VVEGALCFITRTALTCLTARGEYDLENIVSALLAWPFSCMRRAVILSLLPLRWSHRRSHSLDVIGNHLWRICGENGCPFNGQEFECLLLARWSFFHWPIRFSGYMCSRSPFQDTGLMNMKTTFQRWWLRYLIGLTCGRSKSYCNHRPGSSNSTPNALRRRHGRQCATVVGLSRDHYLGSSVGRSGTPT
jgi:hypothetical protein